MSLKRSLSDSECDDLFSDTKDSCMTPPGCSDHLNNNHCGSGSGGGANRKKRRGIIEKRRRDRINNSLTELRRLVPTAFEKQGSAKLEKAEILQMTVDHLKMLHAKGLDALAYDPHKFAMDYHSIGFRECAAEVARYLVNIEGMDIQDPLRLRLMSHLQCFAAQRELANKQASASTWGLNSLTATAAAAAAAGGATTTTAAPYSHHFNTGHASGLMEATSPSQSLHHYQQAAPLATQQQLQHQQHTNYHTSPSMPNESLLNSHGHSQHSSAGSGQHSHQQGGPGHNLYSASSSGALTSTHSSVLVTNPVVAMSHYHHHHHGGGGSALGLHGGAGTGSGNSSSNTNTYIPNGKFRPWGGTELAY